jgi:hypothetical protein
MKWPSRVERSHPVLGGIGTGIILSMGAVSFVLALSRATPKPTALHVLVMVGFAVGGVLQYVGLQPKRLDHDASAEREVGRP